jgi:hypothetical protein
MSPEPRLELTTLLLCDYAMTSQDGKISAIGIFSQINVSKLPAVHGRLFIVAVLDAEPGQHEISLQVISPKGNAVLQRPPQLRMEVPANATTANFVADLKGLKVEELGRHRIELRAGSRLLGSTPFNVNLVWRQQGAVSD